VTALPNLPFLISICIYLTVERSMNNIAKVIGINLSMNIKYSFLISSVKYFVIKIIWALLFKAGSSV